jgi:hypothetical protein
LPRRLERDNSFCIANDAELAQLMSPDLIKHFGLKFRRDTGDDSSSEEDEMHLDEDPDT